MVIFFKKDTKFVLQQAVMNYDAHSGNKGQNNVYLNKVRETVIYNSPTKLWTKIQNQSMENVRDKLRSVLTERRKMNRRNLNSSGIQNEIFTSDQLLDEVMLDIKI